MKGSISELTCRSLSMNPPTQPTLRPKCQSIAVTLFSLTAITRSILTISAKAPRHPLLTTAGDLWILAECCLRQHKASLERPVVHIRRRSRNLSFGTRDLSANPSEGIRIALNKSLPMRSIEATREWNPTLSLTTHSIFAEISTSPWVPTPRS